MEHVISLIGNPEKPALAPEIAEIARAVLHERGAAPKPVAWLAPGLAAEIVFDTQTQLRANDAHAAVRQRLEGMPVDVNELPLDGRRKGLLVADMESTIIRNEMLDELADYVGMKDKVADITARAMNGELDFADAVRERVALLKGLPATVLNEAMLRVEIMPGARPLVATMRANGAFCALVSGGFGFFTRNIRTMLGFDYEQANELDTDGRALLGTVREPILDRNAKLEALKALAGQASLDLAQSMAVGDGANDLPMLQAAGLGVAYRAKPSVAAAAKIRVNHGDLTALLYLQGYRQDEFIGTEDYVPD
ncbi:MAG: phosphoserine phosphatase SerB [Alphaproteobacteria bacterium]